MGCLHRFEEGELLQNICWLYDTRMRRTCGPKIGFIKEVEILYLCLIFLKPIFDYKLIIDYELNLIAYHQVNFNFLY